MGLPKGEGRSGGPSDRCPGLACVFGGLPLVADRAQTVLVGQCVTCGEYLLLRSGAGDGDRARGRFVNQHSDGLLIPDHPVAELQLFDLVARV